MAKIVLETRPLLEAWGVQMNRRLPRKLKKRFKKQIQLWIKAALDYDPLTDQ